MEALRNAPKYKGLIYDLATPHGYISPGFITFSTGYESRALVDSVSVGQRKLEKSFSSD